MIALFLPLAYALSVPYEGKISAMVVDKTRQSLYTTGVFNNRAYVTKISLPGSTEEWRVEFGDGKQEVNGIDVDLIFGDVYVMGSTSSAFDGQEIIGNHDSGYLTSFKPTGEKRWTRFFGSPGLWRPIWPHDHWSNFGSEIKFDTEYQQVWIVGHQLRFCTLTVFDTFGDQKMNDRYEKERTRCRSMELDTDRKLFVAGEIQVSESEAEFKTETFVSMAYRNGTRTWTFENQEKGMRTMENLVSTTSNVAIAGIVSKVAGGLLNTKPYFEILSKTGMKRRYEELDLSWANSVKMRPFDDEGLLIAVDSTTPRSAFANLTVYQVTDKIKRLDFSWQHETIASTLFVDQNKLLVALGGEIKGIELKFDDDKPSNGHGPGGDSPAPSAPSNVGLIVGIVIGAIAGIAAIAGVISWALKASRSADSARRPLLFDE